MQFVAEITPPQRIFSCIIKPRLISLHRSCRSLHWNRDLLIKYLEPTRWRRRSLGHARRHVRHQKGNYYTAFPVPASQPWRLRDLVMNKPTPKHGHIRSFVTQNTNPPDRNGLDQSDKGIYLPRTLGEICTTTICPTCIQSPVSRGYRFRESSEQKLLFVKTCSAEAGVY
jgi:hypothetical protein